MIDILICQILSYRRRRLKTSTFGEDEEDTDKNLSENGNTESHHH